jgi:hypothetical protein
VKVINRPGAKDKYGEVLAATFRDGVVRRAGQRFGTTRPSHVFELTPEVEQLLSSAYIPLLTQLVEVFAAGLPPHQLETMLRQAGKRLADELSPGKRPTGNLASRVAMVSEMMNEQLGATTQVEANGGYIIRGFGCPLAALTANILGCVGQWKASSPKLLAYLFANVAIALSDLNAVLRSAVVHRQRTTESRDTLTVGRSD